jgi:hypothetical protein
MMFTIEIYDDSHEDKRASAYASQSRNDAPANHSRDSKSWINQMVEFIKTWLVETQEYNRRSNGF